MKLINRKIMEDAKLYAKSNNPDYEYAHKAVASSAY